jgi:hypothetical protein
LSWAMSVTAQPFFADAKSTGKSSCSSAASLLQNRSKISVSTSPPSRAVSRSAF